MSESSSLPTSSATLLRELSGEREDGAPVDHYRHAVLRLAGTSCHEIAWDVSQEILDRLWENQFHHSTGSNKEKDRPTCVQQLCQGCGSMLYPSFNGTTLRTLSKTQTRLPSSIRRTLRRREQRKRRRLQAIDVRERKSKSIGTHKTNDFVILRDDDDIGRLDRNRRVLSCGRCKTKTYLKGFKKESLPTPRAVKYAHENPTRDNSRLGDNFISLPKAQEPPAKSTAFASKKPPPTLLEQKLGRKKKKKKPTAQSSNAKSGNLMSFLSSLNDH